MTKSEFDKIFKSVVSELHTLDGYEAKLLETVKRYSSNGKNINSTELSSMVLVESRKYSEELLYRLLSEVLDLKD